MISRRFRFASALLGIGAALLGTTGSVGAADASSAPIKFSQEQREFYEKQIQPILTDNCYACHGPDKEKRKGDLRLDVEKDAKAKHDDVTPIIPGKSAESLLIAR